MSSTTTSNDVEIAELVRKLLSEAGVSLQEQEELQVKYKDNTTDSPTESVFLVFEDWLGLTTTHDTNNHNHNDNMMMMLSAEDCAPYNNQVYEIFGSILHQSLNPNENNHNTNNLSFQNPLIQRHKSLLATSEEDPQQQQHSTQQISLFQTIIALRVTRWLRQWMDLRVVMPATPTATTSTALKDEIQNTFSYQLQTRQPVRRSRHDDEEEKDAPIIMTQRLLHALYHHLIMLPHYQSQMHMYTQAVSRGDLQNKTRTTRHFSSQGLRVQHFQQSQWLIQTLTQEWEQHVQDLEYILGEWYRVGTPSMRIIHRLSLGRLWNQFLSTTAAQDGGGGGGGGSTTSNTSSSLRVQNTSASGIAMTLRVLYRILQGQSKSSDTTTTTKTTAVQEQLLFQYLLPLHQPNALVLWRDQTCLLELYHEPLTKCMALLLQYLHKNEGTALKNTLPTVCLALLQADKHKIWSHTNTPKKVILLHEVDLYLGLLDQVSDEDLPTVAFVSSLLQLLGTCMASEHSRLAERALMFFKNQQFLRLLGISTTLQQQQQPQQQDKTVTPLHSQRLLTSLKILLPVLVGSGSKEDVGGGLGASQKSSNNNLPWNPTVRRMTYHILNDIYKNHPTEFGQAAVDMMLHRHDGRTKKNNINSASEQQVDRQSNHQNTTTSSLPATTYQPSLPATTNQFSLKAGMGDWRPNVSTTKRAYHPSMPPPASRGKTPPLGVTGVAPWARSSTATKGKATAAAPPLTVTGVAPWAQKSTPHAKTSLLGPLGVSKRPRRPLPPGIISTSPPSTTTTNVRTAAAPSPSIETVSPSMQTVPNDIDGVKEEEKNETKLQQGLAIVLKYMEQIKPTETDENGMSTWAVEQMSESPSLLPHLKFYDLVFGHDLGEGAFGKVRYARLINQKTTRSHWSEYAVKIVSTTKIKELGYETSIQREIAVLRLLGHPGIARLVSSFRFNDGAYLVLEYASRGDLHSLLKSQGSLDEGAARFVIGSVVAALASIHELGMVYGDLKPENMVITETGHIKLTDFGAARPVTSSARGKIRLTSKSLLKNLREGDTRKLRARQSRSPIENKTEDEEALEDWSAEGENSDSLGDNETYETKDGDDDQAEEEDLRIEGTTAYLPPEVVMGSIPTIAADSWALGCVLYQFLSGRPPLLEADEDMTRNRIVTFHVDMESPIQRDKDDPLNLFQEKHASGISPAGRKVINQLMQILPNERPSMHKVAEHDFFVSDKVDVFTIHTRPAYPLNAGNVAPAPDAKWSRRQMSSVWAPQPKAYDLSISPATSGKGFGYSSTWSTSPIPEGEESTAFFSTSGGVSNKMKSTITASQKNSQLDLIQEDEYD